MDSERRHAPRYPFIAEAEVTEISSDTKLVAKTSDLSIGGCFLDMLNPSPQGTDVRVSISHEGATFTGRGSVVFVHRTWVWESFSRASTTTSKRSCKNGSLASAAPNEITRAGLYTAHLISPPAVK